MLKLYSADGELVNENGALVERKRYKRISRTTDSPSVSFSHHNAHVPYSAETVYLKTHVCTFFIRTEFFLHNKDSGW